MGKFTVKFYKGDYSERQRSANTDKVDGYIEFHFNATAQKVQTTADYAVCIVGRNASKTSIEWGKAFSKMINDEFNEVTRVGGIDGVLIGGYGGRGDSNLSKTEMPAILVEPLFCNDPEHATIIKSSDGQERLAKVLVESIKKTFPNGAKVGFSVGHKYKTSNPKDLGAAIYGGGYEADYAEKVLQYAEAMLLKL